MKRTDDMQLLNIFRGTYPYWRMICIYRYFSLILTSVFCLVNRMKYESAYGFPVVGCIAIAALTLNYFYIRYETDERIIKLLTTIETISNIVILIPTGGLESPYIWYSLNTVIITSCFLGIGYFIFNLISYTGFLAVTSFYLLDYTKMNLVKFFYENSNLILSYILIIFAIQLLMSLIKILEDKGYELSHVNRELIEANRMIEESMTYIASLFQSLQDFIAAKDKSVFSTIITEHTKNITNTSIAFMYLYKGQNEGILEIREDKPTVSYDLLQYKLEQLWSSVISSTEPLRFVLNEIEFVVAPVKSPLEVYGVMGIALNDRSSSLIKKENINQIKFLASLVLILFERFKIEEMNQLLVVSDEQNRIANEIHDSVSQRLFYISCKVHSIIASENMGETEINRELELVRDCLGSAMKELRDTIYNYGSKDRAMSRFEESIRSYIDEISVMSGVNISLNIKGNRELISLEQKKALYRIICEGIGNSIRHGRSKNIRVDLYVERDNISLKIYDDGIGFDVSRKVVNDSIGLGIRNLYNLASICNGNISIQSQPHKGTMIDVLIPNTLFMKAGQEDTLCV